MIKQKEYKDMIMFYSDKGCYIKRVGYKTKLQVAYEKKPVKFSYVETGDKINKESEEE